MALRIGFAAGFGVRAGLGAKQPRCFFRHKNAMGGLKEGP
jgi:hypothetical protein